MPMIQAIRLTLLFLMLFCHGGAQADKRHPDPDGCFSCHGLPDLKYIDKQGQVRQASILKADYYGSLHGSVPCKDCHRKITDYPHEEKEGLVDCSESCHVKEPSDGKAFTHKEIAEEFKTSAHGKGWTKDFAAGNRIKEDEEEGSLPSCRRCHANDPYIAESQMAAFKEAFEHNDAECGTCHAGDVWRNQFSGHILRRYIGNRISKNYSNSFCIDCHGNIERMSKVKQEDPVTKEKKPVSLSFIHSTETYDKTLHGRLLKDGSLAGASCVECHAPSGLHHGIMRDENPLSAVNELHLSETCGQSGCHKNYAKSGGSLGFLTTDMHSVATIGLGVETRLENALKETTNWHKAAWIFLPLSAVLLLGSLVWRLTNDPGKLSETKNNSILGAENFQRIIIGTKGSKARPKEGPWDKIKRRLSGWFGAKPAQVADDATAHAKTGAEAPPVKQPDVKPEPAINPDASAQPQNPEQPGDGQ